jgi:hypothetical protein
MCRGSEATGCARTQHCLKDRMKLIPACMTMMLHALIRCKHKDEGSPAHLVERRPLFWVCVPARIQQLHKAWGAALWGEGPQALTSHGCSQLLPARRTCPLDSSELVTGHRYHCSTSCCSLRPALLPCQPALACSHDPACHQTPCTTLHHPRACKISCPQRTCHSPSRALCVPQGCPWCSR